MAKYDFKTIEAKWQKYWLKNRSFEVHEDDSKPKYFALSEFPGPTAKGIHVGNARCYTNPDVNARYRRFCGYNVLQPIGWDAFGLPTENFALKMGIDPRVSTQNNIERFRRQFVRLGGAYDWSRELSTTDPEYYKWTQFIFLKLYQKGLAYRSKAKVNFCPKCNSTLSNEDSQGGVCDRCGSAVEQKERDVWFLRITAYADRMLELLEKVDYPDSVKEAQRNWIGRSEGALVTFCVADTVDALQVFTTRIDTIFGVAYVAIAPEHPYVAKYKDKITNFDEVQAYVAAAKNKTNFERTQLNKDKTGVMLQGLSAINPANGQQVPIFVADYVVADYGTGAVMAVPAHDQRDYCFAQKFGIKFVPVLDGDTSESAFEGDAPHINSGDFDGLNIAEAKREILEFLGKQGKAVRKVNYKMQDWAFNRQRYWGEPFPIVHCPKCGVVPLSEADLPLELPLISDYQPSENGDSPLARAEDWVNTTCPHCGGKAKREVDIMPNWAGSSWYWLRYMDPHNSEALASPDKLKYWNSVDLYTGGFEHVTRHMIYAQFWHLFLHDLGVVPFEVPFAKRVCCGLVLASDGSKMSKSKGTAVDPIEVIDEYGADTLRTFLVFLGDYTKPVIWSYGAINGASRFLERVWGLGELVTAEEGYCEENEVAFNKTIKKVTADYQAFTLNTIVSSLMELINHIYEHKKLTRREFREFLVMLNPIAPHITSELYEMTFGAQILDETFPSFDPAKCVDNTISLPVQVNGKLRGTISIPRDSDQAAVEKICFETLKNISRDAVKKVIYIKNKILNIIV